MRQTKLLTCPSDSSIEILADILKRDGCVILKDFLSKARVASILAELSPYMMATNRASSDFGGFKTIRTGALIARSQICRELAIDPRLIDLAVAFLTPYANTIQLHVTQAIRVLPGEKAQMAHRDRWAWSQIQLPPELEPQVNPVLANLLSEIEPQLNIMLAITEFTDENGATRIAPGSSHYSDDVKLPDDAFVAAEMSPGSLLVFTGSVFHGAGANRTQADLIGLNIYYSIGWLRQEDNQYLSCPPEIAKDLDPKLQELLGYAVGGPSLGYFTPPLPAGEDLSSPLKALEQTHETLRLDADGRLSRD